MTSVLILKRNGIKDMLEMERGEWKQKILKPWLPLIEKDSRARLASHWERRFRFINFSLKK